LSGFIIQDMNARGSNACLVELIYEDWLANIWKMGSSIIWRDLL